MDGLRLWETADASAIAEIRMAPDTATWLTQGEHTARAQVVSVLVPAQCRSCYGDVELVAGSVVYHGTGEYKPPVYVSTTEEMNPRRSNAATMTGAGSSS